jgi:UDP-N-acetylmuramoyl-tripeptide--D-alanyl-D-alanine ligase
VRVTAGELASIVDGTLEGDAGAAVTSYAIDSRVLEPGACFVALKDSRDGHDFVADAFGRGARAALVARPVKCAPGAAIIVVPDPLSALARIAARVRDSWADTTIVGITGSAGKTATKDLTAAAFGDARHVHASPGSFNNEAGLPLTLLGAPDGVDVVIAEMGARFPGNIADLCEIARPDIGVVTHIGLAHAEHLGGRAGITNTKGELVAALPASGIAVLNADDDATPILAARTAARVLRVGESTDADVVVRDLVVDRDLRPRFHLETPWGSAPVFLGVRGAHQAENAAMGAAVALVLDVPIDIVAAGLEAASTAEWRMQLAESPAGITVLNDAYNASPSSMAAAVQSLALLPVSGQRVAVLGDMLELGDHAEAEHAALGDLAAEVGLDLLVAVGPASRVTADRARAVGLDVVMASDRDAVMPLLARRVHPGDAVLVKASRAVGLETVAEALARGELDQ